MNKITIYDKTNFAKLKKMPILDDGQIYIYVMLNSQGHIKIGKTTNIVQRIQSLSGSNGGGNSIVKVYVSSSTWLHSIESTCHSHYDWYRIKGTEWFNGEKLTYLEVVKYVDSLFYSKGYDTCNELRKKVTLAKMNEGNKE